MAEWDAYSRIEPFGQVRADIRAGIISAVIANSNRTKKNRAYKYTDFMPNFDPPARQSWQQMQATIKNRYGK